MGSRNVIGGTSPEELYRFAKELATFSNELSSQIARLARETDEITSNSWRGEKADEFSSLIHETKEDIDKQIGRMEELSSAIKDKAAQLETANQRRFSR